MRASRTLPVVYCRCGRLVSLPQTRRDMLLVPGDASHRTARLAPAAVIEGRRKTHTHKKGAFTSQHPRRNKTNGVYISPLCCLRPPIMSLCAPPSLPGLKGGRKEIRHSSSFADQVAFPGCAVCLLCDADATCCCLCLRVIVAMRFFFLLSFLTSLKARGLTPLLMSKLHIL